jgi:ribosomal protein S18 acetylase RimI-like enzyme
VSDTTISIRSLDIAEIGLVEPLWNALREHHTALAPTLDSPRPREESWARRRTQYENWLAEPGSFILVAEQANALVGYAMVHLRSASPTWSSSEQAGEIETLSVLPEMRGQGIGTALLQGVRERLKPLGLSELSLHVLAGNDDATRFYERHGFSRFATWLRAG